MALRVVEVPRRIRGAATITDEEVENAVREIKAGRAVIQDELLFADRRDAQTEAWRWRHELAKRSDLDVSDLKSSTYPVDSGSGSANYRFAIYSWRHFDVPAEATG